MTSSKELIKMYRPTFYFSQYSLPHLLSLPDVADVTPPRRSQPVVPYLLSRVPVEIIQKIIGYCDLKTKRKLALVCQETHRHTIQVLRLKFKKCNFGLCDSPEEWKSYYEQPSVAQRRPYFETCNTIVLRLISSGNVHAFQNCLRWGLNIRSYISEGYTVLSYALSAKNESVAWYLLSEKLIEADDICQQLGLYRYAESLASMTVMEDKEWLLNNLMDLDLIKCIASLSPEATIDLCSKFSVDTIMRLLRSGLPLTAKHRWTGLTLLHVAAERADSKVLEWILDKVHKDEVSWVFEPDEYGWTALQRAIRSKLSRDKNAGLLLAWVSIAKDKRVNFRGNYTLWLAAWYGNLPAVELLLRLGCDPNYVPKGSSSDPLHQAVKYTREHLGEKGAFANGCRIISLLVGYGARPYARNA
ncbi:Ankyrin-2 [Aspergillus hancockii]|nr:Ankyrin-2 [Aspergillus hancockii]